MNQAQQQMMVTNELNGLDIDQLVETVEAIEEQPMLAEFEFRTLNKWVSGGENRSRIKYFYGCGAEDVSRTEAYEFTNGEPPVLLGKNEGANPAEFLLHALAGCVTTTIVLHAAAQGIEIKRLATEVKGQVDLQGLLGLGDDVFPGYGAITIRMDIEADCTEDELEDLIELTKKRSVIFNTVAKPVPVMLERV